MNLVLGSVRRAALVGLGVAVGTAVAFGAPTAHAADEFERLEIVSVTTTDHPEVRVVVAPPASMGGVVLNESAFALSENGERRPIKVRALDAESLDVVLVVDTSGSMRDAMGTARAAARSFVESMPAGTRIALVGFGDTPTRVLPFGDDRAALLRGIDSLTASGETALHDALVLAAEQFQSSKAGRRSIVLLSDGADTASVADASTAMFSLVAAKADLAAVSLVTPETDATALRSLVDDVGGRLAAVDDAASLESVYSAIASQLAHQYVLTFESRVDGLASLEIAAKRGDVTATSAVDVQFPSGSNDPGPANGGVQISRPDPIAVPEPIVAAEPEGLGGSWTLLAGAGALFAGLFVFGLLVVVPRQRRRRLSVEVGVARARRSRVALGDAADRLAHYAEDVLERRGNRRVLNQALEQAGIPTSAGEFIVIIACIALGGGLVLGLLAGSFAVTIIVAGTVAIGARAFVSIQAARRREQFNAQLGDTLQLLGAHLRTGYSLLQSFDIIAKEAEAPTSVEFRRLVTETRLGRDVGEALEAMHDRVGSEDFQWVTQAIEVHREVGGDLAEVLENVAVTIRDRDHVRRQVKALSADGRISAIVLIALPFVLMGGLAALNPDYISELFDRTGGRVALAFAGMLIAVGATWMRRIIRLKF